MAKPLPLIGVEVFFWVFGFLAQPMGNHALEPSALGAARHVVAGQVSKGFAGFLHTYGAFGSAARHRGRFLPHGLQASPPAASRRRVRSWG